MLLNTLKIVNSKLSIRIIPWEVKITLFSKGICDIFIIFHTQNIYKGKLCLLPFVDMRLSPLHPLFYRLVGRSNFILYPPPDTAIDIRRVIAWPLHSSSVILEPFHISADLSVVNRNYMSMGTG